MRLGAEAVVLQLEDPVGVIEWRVQARKGAAWDGRVAGLGSFLNCERERNFASCALRPYTQRNALTG